MSNVTYPDILEGLSVRVYSLDLKVAILHTLLQHRSEEMIRAAPIVFGFLAESLLNDVLLTLAKLYECNSDRSIYKLLEAAEQQTKLIPWKSALTAMVVHEHRATIAARQDALKAIEGRRNKFLAHYDKQYFTAPSKLDEDFPISANEVIEVLRATQSILADHSTALRGFASLSMGEFAAAATETMLSTLAEAERRERGERSI